jgi:Lrp/AsnC family leucine-responsive transcriptional regulator
MKTPISDNCALDTFDLGLLVALQQDAYATHQAMGERIHLSASQVSRRIQRLQEAGLIARFVALLHPAAVGLGVRAVSYVTLTRHGGDEGRVFEQDIMAIPEVLDCYAVAGESDYVLQIVAPDLQALSETVLRRLTRIPGVGSIRSNVVLNTIKASTVLPLSHLLPGRPAAGR